MPGQLALPPGNTPPVPQRRGSGFTRLTLSRTDWLQLSAALALTLGGVVFLAIAAGWTIGARNAERAWVASPERRTADQVVTAPTPIWLPSDTTQPAVPAQLFIASDGDRRHSFRLARPARSARLSCSKRASFFWTHPNRERAHDSRSLCV